MRLAMAGPARGRRKAARPRAREAVLATERRRPRAGFAGRPLRQAGPADGWSGAERTLALPATRCRVAAPRVVLVPGDDAVRAGSLEQQREDRTPAHRPIQLEEREVSGEEDVH